MWLVQRDSLYDVNLTRTAYPSSIRLFSFPHTHARMRVHTCVRTTRHTPGPFPTKSVSLLVHSYGSIPFLKLVIVCLSTLNPQTVPKTRVRILVTPGSFLKLEFPSRELCQCNRQFKVVYLKVLYLVIVCVSHTLRTATLSQLIPPSTPSVFTPYRISISKDTKKKLRNLHLVKTDPSPISHPSLP